MMTSQVIIGTGRPVPDRTPFPAFPLPLFIDFCDTTGDNEVPLYIGTTELPEKGEMNAPLQLVGENLPFFLGDFQSLLLQKICGRKIEAYVTVVTSTGDKRVRTMKWRWNGFTDDRAVYSDCILEWKDTGSRYGLGGEFYTKTKVSYWYRVEVNKRKVGIVLYIAEKEQIEALQA